MTITEKLTGTLADKGKVLFSNKEYLITNGVDEHGLKLCDDSLVGVFWSDGNHVKRTMFDKKAYNDDREGYCKVIS